MSFNIIKFLKKHLPNQITTAYYASYTYNKVHGHYPNLFTPKTFTEKIQKRKVFDRDPILPKHADKVVVKDFICQKLGKEWVTPTLWHGNTLPPLKERQWPLPFVIKANHASGTNIFVRTEAECDWQEIERKVQNWMNSIHGYYFGEWLYTEIKPQILIEPFISEISTMPLDYRLWTFQGKVEIIQVDSSREAGLKRNFYDKHWQQLPFSQDYPLETKEIPPPQSLKEMINAAELLAENISFVRVDFYEIHGKPLFGELTYYPFSGYRKFTPPKYDMLIGKLWK